MTEKETSDLIRNWAGYNKYDFRKEFSVSKYNRVDFAVFDNEKNMTAILEVKAGLENNINDIKKLRLYLNQCSRYSEYFKVPCFLGPIFVDKDASKSIKELRGKSEVFKYFQEFSAAVNVGIFVVTALEKSDPTTWACLDCFINKSVTRRRTSVNFLKLYDKINARLKLNAIKEPEL